MLTQRLSRINPIIKISILIITFSALITTTLLLISPTRRTLLSILEDYTAGNYITEISVIENIPFQEEATEDNSLAQGAIKIKQDGVFGKKEIIYKIQRNRAGDEISRIYIREKILSNPINKIISKGTQAPITNNPSRAVTGINKIQPESSADTSKINNTNHNQFTENNNNHFHYCTTPKPGWGGRRWGRHYLKINTPCGQTKTSWDNHIVEVTYEEYISNTSIVGVGPENIILEARHQDCGNEYSHPDESCKIYN